MANRSVDASMEPSPEAWQLRLERWGRVQHLLDRAELGAGRLRHECLQAAATELLLLAAGEALWSYPSPARLEALRRILAAGDVTTAAAEAREILAMLTATQA